MPDLSQLRSLTTAARSQIERRKGERDALRARLAELNAALTEARAQTQTITHAVALLREASDYARRQALDQVQNLTSSALQAVFGDGYKFRLEAGQSGGRPVVTCRVRSPYGDGDEITTEGVDSRGGGITDIQAIALRWAMLETHRPLIDGPLLLDEPAKHVSAEHVPAVGRFLREACTRFGRQVIMVTHIPHLAELADRVVSVRMRDGVSVVEAR